MGNEVGVPVLIVGGGPIGLAAAIGLRRFGVECMLVERHESTLDFPKGRGVTVRSMEIFRQWGLEQAVVDIALPRDESLFVFQGNTLFAEDFRRAGVGADDSSPFSPTQRVICSQEMLEPLLRKEASTLGADLRFSTRMTAFMCEESGVTAELVDMKTGNTREVHAQWLVAADGGRSEVRSSLGIVRSGAGSLGDTISILVDVDLAGRVNDRKAAVYWLNQPRQGAALAAVDNRRRWLLMMPYDPKLEPQEVFTDDHCAALARAALGDSTLDPTILGKRFWQPTSAVADHFRVGPVFLAGDAAHLTTPLGGLGMNCGLADAHNLAWKLAGVVCGWAEPSLLDSYEPERQPIARACAEASLGRARPPAPVDGLVFGAVYDSAAIYPDGSVPPEVEDPVSEYLPVARPGHRAPHLWLDANRTQSTLDLFGDSFTILIGPSGNGWRADAKAIEGIPIRLHTIDHPDWLALYGIEPTGAVLVRPDGYVAWRAVGKATELNVLRKVFRQMVGTGGTE